MGNKKIFILVSIVLAIGAGIFVFLRANSNNQIGNISLATPAISASPSVSPAKPSGGQSKTGGQNKNISEKEMQDYVSKQYLIPTTVPYSQLTGPATCQVRGTLKFWSHSGYENDGAKLTYTGIDSPARQIKWKISPSGEDLGVGPNLMSPLRLPDGEYPISAVLPTSPQFKNYTLTASMTYGRLVGEGVRVYEVSCSGEAKIELDY